MALTMTRTRTQTTLTKLAELVANVHGELAFVEGLLAGPALAPGVPDRLTVRRVKLIGDRDALYATIRQFDPAIDPLNIGTAQDWRKQFGSRRLGDKGLAKRYLRQLATLSRPTI